MRYLTVLYITILLVASFAATSAEAEETGQEIFDRALQQFRDLDTLQVEGVAHIEMAMAGSKMEIENVFTIRLGRPNRYFIQWGGIMMGTGGGTLWNPGSGAFMYMNNSYFPIEGDSMALAAATGVSSGAASNLPSLFLDLPDNPSVFAQIKDVTLSRTEEIDGIECHVLQASSALSDDHLIWISKADYLIRKHTYTMNVAKNLEKMKVGTENREQIQAALGEEVPENVQQGIDTALAMAKTMQDVKMGETYTTIALNPAFTEEDFVFTPPDDATKAESLMASMSALMGQQESSYNKKFQVGDTAPDFTSPGLDGAEIRLADYKGKVVLLDFWATWCGPCIAELPNLIEAYETFHPKGLDIIGISLDDNKADLEAFLAEHRGIKWTTAFDGQAWQSPLAKLYGVEAIPFTLLLDKDGVIQYQNLRGSKLEEALAEMLGEPEIQQ